MHLKGRRWHF